MNKSKSLFQMWKNKSPAKIIIEHFRSWWKSSNTPDPWPSELDAAVYAPDAIPVCRKCLTPGKQHEHFCSNCGAALGAYNNFMPYVHIFSIGELLRTGVGQKASFTPFRVVAYFFIALSQYLIFAPFYLFRLYLNYRRQKKAKTEQTNIISD